MPGKSPTSEISNDALRRRHEFENPRPGWIFAAAGITVALLFFALGASGWFMKWSPPHAEDHGAATILSPDLKLLTRFPAPTLQVNGHDDLSALRAREDAAMTQYAWIDRTNGVVRIPITRAMEVITQRGLGATNGAKARSSEDLIRERSKSR
jgi:hypothetical protein